MIKNHIAPRVLIAIALGALFFVLLIVTFVAYLDFSSEAENLRQLQDEYRQYIGVLKTVAHDAAASTEDVAHLESIEKKKPFSVVDRRRDHLKQSLRRYISQKGTRIEVGEIERLYSSYDQEPSFKKNKPRNARKARTVPLRSRRIPKTATSVPALQMPAESERVTDFTLSWPIERDKFWISSFFGPRRKANGASGFHYGIDLASVKGNPVLSAGAGRVVEARSASGYGNTVVIMHNEKYKTRYAHLQSIKVRVGQEVGVGKQIGTVGDTGHIRRRGRDGSHLHFEVYSFGRQINPLLVLSWSKA